MPSSAGKPPYPPAYLDPIFHQPMPERREAPGSWCRETWRQQEEYHQGLLREEQPPYLDPRFLEAANRAWMQNHRNTERRAAWRMRCLDRLGFVPDGDVAKWRDRI